MQRSFPFPIHFVDDQMSFLAIKKVADLDGPDKEFDFAISPSTGPQRPSEKSVALPNVEEQEREKPISRTVL